MLSRISSMTRIASVMMALLLLAACSVRQPSAYTVVHTPAEDDPIDAHVYELPNGLRVYISVNREEPRFYSEIAVRAGSKHDPADTTGLAHYLEHLLFKGSTRLGTLDYEAEKPLLDEITELYEEHFVEEDPARRAEIYDRINAVSSQAARFAVPNEFDQLYGALGGSNVNAHTWREETVYKVELPNNRLEDWAIVESDRFANPVFRLFHTELETVYEEKNRSMDNPFVIVWNAVDKNLYLTHPYGQTPYGEAEHLKRPSIKRIHEYFDTWYVPNNMAIVISGDVDPEETIKIIARHFSSLEAKPLPPNPPLDEPPLDSVRRATVHFPGEEAVMLAFRTAPYGHEDTWALEILSKIFDNSTAGLINLNLVQTQRVREAGAFPLEGNDYGTQFLWATTRDDQTVEQLEELLLEQVRLVREGEFEDWLLEAIVNDLRKEHERAFESNVSRASRITSAFIAHRSWIDARHDLDRYAAVSREDVLRVANEYFQDGYVAVYRKDGPPEFDLIEKPRIDPLEIDTSRRSEFAASILAREVEPIEPRFLDPDEDVRVVDNGSGRRIYHTLNPVNQLYQLQVIVEKGSDHDIFLSTATRLMNVAGTARLAPDELSKEWYRIGTDFSINNSGNQVIVTIAGLDDQFEEALALLREVLAQPAATDEALNELVSIILDKRETDKKSPDAINDALVQYNRHGEESAILEVPTAAELRATTTQELLVRIRDIPRTEHSIAYVGPLELDELQRILARSFPVAPDGLAPVPPPRFRQIREVEETEILFVDQKVAQSRIRIESAGPLVDPSRRPPVVMFNEYFGGGMSSVVFQEIREARALAYSAGAVYRTGSRLGEQDLMIGVVGTQVDKTIEALEAMLDLMDNPPSEEPRFDLAVAAVDGQIRTTPTGFRGRIGEVRSWERLGLDSDPRREVFESLKDATIDDMMGFHHETIHAAPKLISIVGDKDRIDMEALGKIGKVRTVEVDEIFPR